MGMIANTILSLKDKILYFRELKRACRTDELQDKMMDEVYEAFSLLKPLADSSNEICVIHKPSSYYHNDILTVGSWIRVKRRWEKYSTAITSRYYFFEFIREYGDKIARHVRKSIRGEFLQLLKLTRELKSYDTLTYTHPINKAIYWITSLDKLTDTVVKLEEIIITTNTDRFLTVKLSTGDMHSLYLDTMESMPVLEDIIDDVIKAYERVKKNISAVKEHNDKVMEEIRMIYLPRKLSKAMDDEQ